MMNALTYIRRFMPINLLAAFGVLSVFNGRIAFEAPLLATCANGFPCKCVDVQVNTCDSAGLPPPCALCRYFFLTCFDSYCLFQDSRCDTGTQGPTTCMETLISTVKGLQRQCISGPIDWTTCFGENQCISNSMINTPGNRYNCTLGGGG
jgi:hypothetical protein